MPQLIISIEGDYPKFFDLERDEISIGRHSENDIQLPFDFISSFHALLTSEPGGDYRLTDRESHNGTTVNGNNLGSALLEDGDEISFGGIRAAYRVGARKLVTPKPAAPRAANLDGPPLQATAPISIPKPGEIQSLSEVELQARLREKAQKEIAKEFEEEKKRIEDLKRIAGELEADNAEARAKLESAETKVRKAERAASERQSDMAMREHMVRDLEKARGNEERKLQEAQAVKEALEREKLILQHELTVGAKDLERIKNQIAQGKEAAGNAKAAFKKNLENEKRSARLDSEIVAKEKTLADLGRSVEEREENLRTADRELQAKRGELEEMGSVRLVDLTRQIEELETKLAERKDGLTALIAEREETQKKLDKLNSLLAETGSALEKTRRSRDEQQKEIEEQRARKDTLVREIGEHEARKKDIAAERKSIEEALVKSRAEHDELDKKIEQKQKAAQRAKKERGKIEEFQATRKRLEVDLAARREQLTSLDTDLASKRRALGEVEEALAGRRAELEEISSVRISKLRAEAADLQKKSGGAREKLEAVEKEIAETGKKRDERLSALAEKTSELEKLEKDCAARAAEVAELETRKDSLLKERETAGGALKQTKGELETARIQLDDQKKIAKKIAAELRTLEERKSQNEKLEAAIREGETRLKEIETEVTGRRQSLRQVEKELASRQKSLRKQTKKDRFNLASALGGSPKNGAGEPPADEKASDKTAAADGESGTDAEAGAEVIAKREELENENRKLSQLIAEKAAALRKLEEEIAGRRPGDRGEPADSEATTKPGEKRIDLPRITSVPGKARSLSERPATGLDRGRIPEKGGIELLKTDAEDSLPNENAKPGSEAVPDKTKFSKTKEEPAETPEADAGDASARDSNPPVGPPLPAATAPVKPEPFSVAKPSHGQNGREDETSRKDDDQDEIAADSDIVPLRIIHPRTREMIQYYHDGAGSFDSPHHPPVGFHALAACTKGSVHRTVESLPLGDFAALVLLGGSLDKDREIIRHVSRQIKDKPLLACWREGRLDRLASQLEGGSDFQHFTEMLGAVDGLISTDARTSSLLDELQVARRYAEIPLPYPIDAKSWNFSIPIHERSQGILVSGDGFDPGSEEHKARISLVNTLAERHRLKVTVYHHLPDILTDLSVPADLLSEPNKTLNYGEFLSLMAQHRFVIGFGKNFAGGEIWGDALLVRNVYLGAHGPLESVLFPDTAFPKNSADDISKEVARLLEDASAFEESVAESHRRALGKVSFKAARTRLSEFLGTISQELLTIG